MTQTETTPGAVSRLSEPGIDLTTIASGDLTELAATILPLPGESLPALVGRLASVLEEGNAQIVQLTAFGPVAVHAEAAPALTDALGTRDFPLTWVEGALCDDGPIAGIHVHAVSGADMQTLKLDGRPVGVAYQQGPATVCQIGGLGPADVAVQPGPQTTQTYERLEATLQQVDMDMSNVARTWLYLDDILSWYGELNVARTQFFTERKVFDGLVPASTGIAGSNPSGSAIVLQALAVKSSDPAVTVEALPSPLQCPALQYGSSFSRAVEIRMPGTRRITVSGTASIAQSGDSTHLGDVDKQVACTVEVVKAILESRQMSLADVVRTYVYFKYPKDARAWDDYCQAQGVKLPAIVAAMDVCRDELLFEMELDAIVAD